MQIFIMRLKIIINDYNNNHNNQIINNVILVTQIFFVSKIKLK